MPAHPSTTVRTNGSRGFTLVEIMVVLALVGLMMTLVVMRMDNMSPKYALRSASREIGGTIDLARGHAAGKGIRTAVEYDLDHNEYRMFAEPREYGVRGDGPFGMEPVGGVRRLPSGIYFRGVLTNERARGGQQRGTIVARFDPLSIEGSHIVYLESDVTKKQMSVKFNALIGSCDYAEGMAEFEAPPE